MMISVRKKTTILFLVLGMTTAYSQTKPNTVGKFDEVMNYVTKMYVDDVDGEALAEKAISKMLHELDPHSSYIPKEEVDDANERINGSFVGIGIRFQILKDTLQVVQTIPGGPSEKVGLLAGDRILKIEAENVAGVGLKNGQVREKLMGEKGSKVKIEVLRGNSKKSIHFTVTRDKIPVFSVDSYYMATPEIGYIKLNSFSKNSLEEVRTSIDALKKQGMKELILDLQGNGGGLLYSAQEIADEFLSGDKLIVYSEGRTQPRTDLSAGVKGLWEEGKMVVLTDEYTASSSEIVSGAIQDWDRGLIVGRRTFGKGLVQRPINLKDGSQIRLTIARYFTPSGRFIQKPYDDNDKYEDDISERYKNGEFSSVDSIKFPDSLKHTTLLTNRTVYSGGGIMPDVFVPLDTAGMNEMFKIVARGGYFSSFALTYLNANRKKMTKNYPDFGTFKSSFVCDKKLMTEFFDFVAKENKDFNYSETDYQESKKLIDSRLKATFAQDMFGYSEFYEIYNENNEILQKAIEVLQSNTYDKMNLAIAH